MEIDANIITNARQNPIQCHMPLHFVVPSHITHLAYSLGVCFELPFSVFGHDAKIASHHTALSSPQNHLGTNTAVMMSLSMHGTGARDCCTF